MITIKAYISENSNHCFLGLIGLLIRENFVISSSSTISSSITSFLPLLLSLSLSLLLLSPYYNKAHYKSFPPRCYYYNRIYFKIFPPRYYYYNRAFLSYYYYYNKIYNKASYINIITPGERDISKPSVKGIVAFFLTKLLPLFISLKIASSR